MEDEEVACDIISALSTRLMNDIAEKIFNYLDYQSLKRSEKVSEVWHNNILFGKMWEKLLEREVQISPKWRELYNILMMKWPISFNIQKNKEFYRKFCQLIGDSVLRLDYNWKHGNHSKLQFWSFSQPDIESLFWIRGSLTFEMNKKWIGRGQRDGSVILWNRWTLHTKALYEPLLLTNRLHGCNTVRGLQFNDELVVASYFGGEICIWDTSTAELLHILDEMDLANYESHYIPMNGLCLGGVPGRYLLLSCLASPSEQAFVTLREIKSLRGEVFVCHRILLEPYLRVLQMLVNSMHALLLLCNTRTKQDLIQIRSTVSMEIVRVIAIPYSEAGVFDYSDGLIFTGSRYELQLWDINNGNCLKTIHSKTSIIFVQFVSDKYMVSCNAAGQIEVWDRIKALNDDDSSSLRLYQFNVEEEPQPLITPVIRADEYCIALIPNRADHYSELHMIDFLQLDQLTVEDSFTNDDTV